MSKRAEPATVPPGEVLTYTVAVTHTGEAPLSGVVLSDALPAGLVYVEGSAEGFEYLPDEHRLVWTLPELAAGQALQGGFQARVTGYALGQVITNTVGATGGDLAQPVMATVTTLVSLPAADVAWITPAGGVLRSLDGRVEVEFPPEAVQERVRLEYRTLPLSAELPPVLFCAFQLTAFTEREEPVRVFQRPVAITVHTRAEEAGIAPAERLRIFWFDEESGEWLRLPTVADAEKGTLRSEVSHFSLFGAGSSIEYGAQLLPAVNGFSSDEWTGNGSIGYPLRLPPGPGGFAPSLALVYSTETVNGMRAGRAADERPSTYWLQAGVYGFGWNLAGLGAVTINLRNGQAHLSFGADSFKLVGLGNNQWTTDPQTFLKIQHVGEAWSRYRWEIWTAEGTKYIFGDPNDNWGNGSAYVLHTTNCNRQMREAHLTRVEDTHGNAWTVEYTTEMRGIAGCGGDYIKAIYPNTIRLYPAGGGETVRIVFVKDNVPGHPLGWRPDREINGHDNDYVEAFYADYRIGTIEVRVTEGGTWPLVRSYDLGYEYRKANPYDPNDKRGHSLLTSLTEKGASGSALPAFTFSYANEGENFNWTKLGTADNGQGGRVTYVYQEEDFLMGPPYTCGAHTKRFVVQQRSVSDGLGNSSISDYTYSGAWADADANCENFDFAGHQVVQRSDKDGGVEKRHTTTHYYQRDGGGYLDPRKGRVQEAEVRAAAGGSVLAETLNDYQFTTVNTTPFIYLNYMVNTLGSSSQRTAFYYDTDHQGNGQYGQWTRRQEYQDDGATLLRTVERWFYPQTVSGYIVNRVAQEKLWEGEAGTGVCRGQTRYIYDNAPNYMTPPTKGDLTKVRVAQTSCDNSWSDTAYGYDGTGNQTSVTDPLGNVTTTAYDSTYRAYATTVTLPPVNGLSFVITYIWNTQLGQVTQVTDPNNAVTTYTYDQWGRLQTVKRPPDTVNTEEYIYNNYVASPLSPFMITHKQREKEGDNYLYTWTFYDGLGRVVQTQTEAASDSQSILVNREYDGLGNLKRESLPYIYSAAGGTYRTPDWGQPQRQYTYDALGRVTQATSPDGTTVRSYYQDRQTAVIDELNHQTIQEMDALGRLVSVKQYSGSYPGGPGWNDPPYGTTSYGYDVADRLTGVTGPDGAQTTITYDLAGRKTWMSDPDMGAWGYAYDAAGNLRRQTDARNQTVCFYYDALNRLTGKHYRTDSSCPASNPTLNVSYTYDSTAGGNKGKGRRTGMNDPSGSTSWVYDERGRVTRETKVINGTGGGTFVTQWSYRPDDQVNTMTYPGGNGGQTGETVTTTYNPMGLVKSVTGTSIYVGDTTYNALGQVELRKLGSDVLRTDYDYFGASGNFRLQRLKTGTPSNPTSLQDLRYTYDNVGNVLTIKDYKAGGPQTQSFSYDFLDRVVSASVSGGSGGLYSEGYEYSGNGGKVGNLTKKGTTSYTYGMQAGNCPEGALSKPHAVVTAGSNTYCYDQNGNMRRRKIGATTYTLTYDAENRLTGVSGGASASFVYDGDGKRVKATFGSTTTIYVGNYYEQTGSTVKKYYYAGGQRVAMRVGSTLYWLLTDHLGSTAITANSSGSKYAELRYKAWGEMRYTYGTTPTAYKFTGQRLDESTGLMYYGARYYDPALGRFVQADTVVPEPGNPQALNRYAYVLNNPVRYTDPTGHAVCVDEECKWVVHPVSGKIIQRRPDPSIPPVVIYTHGEMVANAQGGVMRLLQSLHRAHSNYSYSPYAAAAVKTDALVLFGYMVRQGGPWDPKRAIGNEYGFSQQIGGAWYYYDIWGNIMFGYLGTAAGFSESELLEGAGLEQIGSSIGYAITKRDSSYLPRREPGASGLRAWDDPVDQVTTRIGINLWNAYGLSVTPMDIIQAIEAEPRIPTRDEPWR